MQKLGRLFLLVVGMTSFVTMAQNADSVIVIYKNQKTVIPVPAYKSQSSISYSDSIRVIEIGVSQRKPGDISVFPQNAYDILTLEKHKSTSKWFSQIEAGYSKGFTETEDVYFTTYNGGSIPENFTTYTSMTDSKGYQIRLHLHEKEFHFDKKKSFVSGFLVGFSQNYLQAKQIFTRDDTTNFPQYKNEKDFDFKINSFHFLYQFGISYHISAWKLPAKINLGNYIGFSVTRILDKNDKMHPGYSHINANILQPYLGLEISKIGVMFSADLNVPHKSHSILIENDMGRSICLSLTYNLF